MNGWGVMGLGTDEDDLTRVVVTRAEKDLKEIKELYYKKNNANIEDHITKNTSGDYKKFLLTVLGKEDAWSYLLIRKDISWSSMVIWDGILFENSICLDIYKIYLYNILCYYIFKTFFYKESNQSVGKLIRKRFTVVVWTC